MTEAPDTGLVARATTMASFAALTPAERASQLRNPEGEVGIAVADWLSEINKAANTKTIALLGVTPGNHVLEIGFGNGCTVRDVVGQAADVRYTGVDISETMVAEATRFSAALVASARASFYLSSAERMPFADYAFDRVFSIGVIHIWADPNASLAEVHRVMRPGGVMVMGCPRWGWPGGRELAVAATRRNRASGPSHVLAPRRHRP